MLTFIDKLNTCVPEIFTEENYIPLPDQICELCCKNLKIVFWFRELCLKSNATLRSYKISLENGTRELDVRFAEESLGNSENKNQRKEQLSEQTTVKDENHLKSCERIEIVNSNTNNIPATLLDSVNERGTCTLVETEYLPADYINVKVKTEITEDKVSQSQININNNNIEQETSNISNELAVKQEPGANNECETQPTAIEQDNSVKKLRHVCSFCGKPFKYRQDMRIHERMHTGFKPYTCPMCSKSFAKSTRLKIHINTHTREKTYTCSVCNKNFNQNSNLIMHMKLHTQTERFACNLCEKTFSQKRHLKQHILFHEDERRYTCDICNWNFTMKHHLKRHMMTHTGQKPARKELPRERERKFPCTKCEWSFMSKEVLKRHMEVHTRENAKLRSSLNDERRRFPCTLCVWSFTKKHHLERHMVKHEQNRRFPCHFCTEEFRKNGELQKHLKLHEHATQYIVGNSLD
ncbi:Meiotic central spindle [Carabus blaptoides fortunei]